MMDVDDDVEAEETPDWVQWAENDSTEDEDIALVAYKESDLVEEHFDLVAFLYESDVGHREKERDSSKRYDHANCLEVAKEHFNLYNGPRIDNCANCSSIISVGRYHAYCQTFNFQYSIKPAIN